MPHFESPVSSNTLASHSCSHPESALLESYVLEASEPLQPTATTTDTTSKDHDSGPTPTAAAGTTTTTHLLSHMHLSPNTTPNHPSHQTIHYLHHSSSYSTASSSSTITLSSTATTNLRDLHQSLLHSQYLDNLHSQEQQQQQQQRPLVVLMLDEHAVRDIPIGDFLPPGPYIPSEAEAEAEDLDVRTVVQQGGYAVHRFFNTGEEEEANVVYARSVGVGRGRWEREG
ncbi:hypothetical protein L873DRAFT_1799442 [Choiromyces venosus 120613-1]|uniref:Uncharacterized protein n=1 Tax=Choiromyces venosus 120613-1 TaxID=1336337 RepID=A0A3N4K1U8_9PEZI|nr:hypothetical protein L873DRAFT_1799442 [Choiromyces venosus 120613-1]